MANKDKVYDTTTVKYVGIFSFSDFYDFCYNWVMSEIEPNEFAEPAYTEKIVGDGKTVEITWEFRKKFTNYFAFDGKITFKIDKLKKIELTQNGKKVKTNHGELKLKVTGTLTKDYENNFERSPILVKLRDIYEEWIIKSRVYHFEDKVVEFCNNFTDEAKAFLVLEGKK